MTHDTITTEAARRFYDRVGARYDWAEFYESRAKSQALDWLDLEPGQQVLNVGVGTGKEHRRLQSAVAPGGFALAVDLSWVMLRLTQARTGAPICQADARALPFATASFDRLYSAYVLDLIPTRELPDLLTGFRRVLKSEGQLVLVSLTEGVDMPSRALVAIWKGIYAVSPVVCGGCRPLRLSGMVREAGFRLLRHEVMVQLGVPSEVVVAAPEVVG